jgi:hypothetical protein
MQVYINYPNQRITVHHDSSCQQIHMHRKEGQRTVKVNPATLKHVLGQLVNDDYEFKAEAQFNDVWLDVSLSTAEQEIGFVHIVQAVLGQRYKRLENAPIHVHC